MIDGVFPTKVIELKLKPHFTKYQVQYENPAKDPRYHCSICEHYINKTTCEIVQGKIDPEAWCNKYERK